MIRNGREKKRNNRTKENNFQFAVHCLNILFSNRKKHHHHHLLDNVTIIDDLDDDDERLVLSITC